MNSYDNPTPDEQEKYIDDKNWKEVSKEKFDSIAHDMKTKAAATKQISLRVKEYDLIKFEARASSQGLKYQSVIKSLIHQYANGQIKI